MGISHRVVIAQTKPTLLSTRAYSLCLPFDRAESSKLLASPADPSVQIVYQPTTVAVVENGGRTEKQERGKALRQIVAAFIANAGTINTGLVFGFSAVVIPQLRAVDSSLPIDESQASWIGE